MASSLYLTLIPGDNLTPIVGLCYYVHSLNIAPSHAEMLASSLIPSSESSHTISEKEFEIIHIINRNTFNTQREIASETKMSLGLINILLKRLVTKGYLRAQQLDRRKVQYILTPRGLAEKTKKSYRYTLKTIAALKSIRSALEIILKKAYDGGVRHFYILGQGDLSSMIEIVLREQLPSDISYERTTAPPATSACQSLLLLTNGPWPIPCEAPSLDLVNSLADTLVHATEGELP
jgi:DNA-binding MarR family transcriptional regulator